MADAFDSWAIVEVMGHRSFAGRVTEQQVAGAGFVRVDVPEVDGRAEFTKLFAPGSIYAITPVDESTAMAYARQRMERPVSIYVAQALPSARQMEFDDNEDHDEPYDGDAHGGPEDGW